MTYDEALAFLNSRLNYESRGMPAQAELRVDRTAILLEKLGRPHDQYRVIHIAGTKGKGSTAMMIAALLEESGFNVGLHTSPHLFRVEERFRVNNRPISSTMFAAMITEMRPAIDEVDAVLRDSQSELTFFEITTALTLLYFARQQVDFAVVEVGMGGRLDSTNVVDPAVSVITSISLDHTKQLGETIPEIAREKAGIIKSGRPVVSSVLDPAAKNVIEERARDVDASLFQLGEQFQYIDRPLGLEGTEIQLTTWRRRWPSLRVGPIGDHQSANAATALAVMDLLESQQTSFPALPGKSLATIRLPGRAEIYHRDPFVLLDVAHNPASFEALTKTLRQVIPPGHKGKRVFVFGTSRDKDWVKMLRTIDGIFTHIILTQYHGNQRALPADEVRPHLQNLNADISVIINPHEAWMHAAAIVGRVSLDIDASMSYSGQSPIRSVEDIICVAGSFYLFSELLGPPTLVPEVDSI